MKIDRHNYEEYFLLYVDNELDAAARAEVEAFAGRHPDLQEELDLLLQFRAEPDSDIAFPDKDQLLKTTSQEPIHAANATEWLLLYTDGELSASETALVEHYLTQQPEAGEELRKLQQCRLEPEWIQHPDKASLYRKEEKVRAIGFRRWRMAAAILFLLLGAFTVRIALRSGAEPATPSFAGSAPGPAAEPRPEKTEPVGIVSPETMSTATAATVSPGNPAPAVKRQTVTPGIITPETNAELTNDVARQAPRDNQLPQPEFNPNVRTDLNPVTRPFTAEAGEPVVAAQNLPLTNAEVTNTTPPSSDIVQAAYTDNGFAENPGKKNKLRGFFRKVTRTFEKRTDIDPTDNNRLLVAGLSIRLK